MTTKSHHAGSNRSAAPQQASAGAGQRGTGDAVTRPRLWPVWGVLLLQLGAIILSVTPTINNSVRFGFMMLGPLACVLLFAGWLLFGSRLRWPERLGYLTTLLALNVGAARVVHQSMGIAVWIYGVPLSMASAAVVLFLARTWRPIPRVALGASALAATCLPFLLLRLEGFDGTYLPEFAWRWSSDTEPDITPPREVREPGTWLATTAEWPAFRGPVGDSRVTGWGDPLDWKARPPVQRWRVRVGPGWSSFACVSGRLFTQEQRGKQELVTCYDADTGDLIWQSAHADRFSDVVSGAGPRATPTFEGGRIFAYGARARLSCLDAATGRLVWQRDMVQEVNAASPFCGVANSPLVIEDVAVVYAGGDGDNGLVAYYKVTGAPVWQVPSRGMNFSSAQRVKLAGRDLILFGDDGGLMALDPSTGRRLWNYKPRDWRGPAICQPQQVDETSLIVPLGDGVGVVRLDFARDGERWDVSERWSSNKLRPSFNDFVYYEGHCYGFDRNILCCLDALTGQRKWKDGRHGFGQVLLLARVGQLIVTTETGDVVLVAADPGGYRELGRVPVLDGKTWNHPVVARGRLYVRNAKEAVCLDLAVRP